MDDYDSRALRRLEAKKAVDGETGCWPFTGATTSNGYGHIAYRGRVEYAHRVAAILFLGYDPNSGQFVLHTCDVPACFNPEHLTLGTQKENMADAAAKGRMKSKKLQAEQVAQIKYRLSLGTPYRELATHYGVSTTAIGQIARGETWKAVDAKPTETA